MDASRTPPDRTPSNPDVGDAIRRYGNLLSFDRNRSAEIALLLDRARDTRNLSQAGASKRCKSAGWRAARRPRTCQSMV
jgi:hypothetical protein